MSNESIALVNTSNRKKGLGAILVLLSLLIVFGALGSRPEDKTTDTKLLSTVIEQGELTDWSSLPVEAKAIYVYDVKSDLPLYAKNERAQLPLASITKVMTVLTALRKDTPGMITIDAKSLDTEGDSGLFLHEEWKLGDLATLALVSSSNDAAEALRSSWESSMGLSFIDEMNKLASELGLENTYFLSPTGLDISTTQASAYGSASDVARMLASAALEYPDVYAATTEEALMLTSESDFSHLAMNTNPDVLERLGILASKTGYTDLAGGNLAIIFDAAIDRPVVVVVLGSTKEARFSDVAALATRALYQLSI